MKPGSSVLAVLMSRTFRIIDAAGLLSNLVGMFLNIASKVEGVVGTCSH